MTFPRSQSEYEPSPSWLQHLSVLVTAINTTSSYSVEESLWNQAGIVDMPSSFASLDLAMAIPSASGAFPLRLTGSFSSCRAWLKYIFQNVFPDPQAKAALSTPSPRHCIPFSCFSSFRAFHRHIVLCFMC